MERDNEGVCEGRGGEGKTLTHCKHSDIEKMTTN